MENINKCNQQQTQLALVATSIAVISAALFATDNDNDVKQKESHKQIIQEVTTTITALRRIKKRVRYDDGVTSINYKRYDYARARFCIYQDYLGETSLFGNQFERIFRISKQIFQNLFEICQHNDSFFGKKFLITGKDAIAPAAKVMIALKQLAFGCSSSAFLDYFQMGETTGRQSLKKFCEVVCRSSLRSKYFRKMDQNDARKICLLHEKEFGIQGCLGCLDCMHVTWRTCPAAWKGQFQGKEGYASVALEAVADYTTWIWHCKFGYPGTLNDINIWDQSSLLKDFLDGTFSNLDFEYEIGGKSFNELYVLVDGIYPELSRFVKTLSVPITDDEKRFSEWQEGSRKSVERAFGILQRKFQILAKPIEYWYIEEVNNIVETCVIMHNMMVETRLEREEKEGEEYYDSIDTNINDCNNSDNSNDNNDLINDINEENNDIHEETDDNSNNDEGTNGNNDEEMNRFNGERTNVINYEPNMMETNIIEDVTYAHRVAAVNTIWLQGNQELSEQVRNNLDEHFDNAEIRWDQLYNVDRHFLLRQSRKRSRLKRRLQRYEQLKHN